VEIKTRKLFKELVKKLTLELLDEEDLEEITSTGSAPGYSTPNAFVGKNKKKKKKKLKQSLKQVGYDIAEEIEKNLKLMIEDETKQKHKPGDVWERPSGDWAGKNSKGDVQGYKSKEDAETWAKGEVPDKKDSTKDEPESEKDAIDREEREELKKKATKGFFKSQWDNLGDKSVTDLVKTAKEKGEKLGQELEKGETPDTGISSKVKDYSTHKKDQAAAAKALRKKQAADAEKEKKAKEAEEKKKEADRKKKAAQNKKKATSTTKKKKKKTSKKKKVKEELDNRDVKDIKKLIRQVVADILRDLWIKRSIWKDKR